MSEVGLERNELWLKPSEDKSVVISWESDEREVPLDHHGLSAITKNSGIVCLICMRFFFTDADAQDHAKSFLHYQRYCGTLLYRNERSFTQDPLQKRHVVEENELLSHEAECYDIHDSYEEGEDTTKNEELWTIKECTGIMCAPCMKFFVNEASAGQHVRSLAHYKKCYNGFEDVAGKLEESFILPYSSDQISCKEEKAYQESSEIVTMKTSETNFHPNYDHCNLIDLQISIKERKKAYEEETKSQNLETTETNVDSLIILDNDWWCEFDNKLGSLLRDISEECGEEIRL